MHKNMLMVTTNEPNCEFLKVTTSDYNRIIEVEFKAIPMSTSVQGFYEICLDMWMSIF